MTVPENDCISAIYDWYLLERQYHFVFGCNFQIIMHKANATLLEYTISLKSMLNSS